MSDIAMATRKKTLKKLGMNYTRCLVAVPKDEAEGFLEQLFVKHQGPTQSIAAVLQPRRPRSRKTEIAIQMLNMSHNEGGHGSDLDRVLKAANGGEMPEIVWRDDSLWDQVYCDDPEHGSRCRGEA